MKKIGILTFQRSANFGAQLQAYALQKTVEKLGYNVEVINYSMTGNNLKDKWIYNTKLLVKSILLNPMKYKKFRKNYNLSKKKYTDRNIETANQEYSCFITGSDQVWNPEYCKKTSTYLLGFSSKKNISYAASFGVEEIDEQFKDMYKKYLSKIDYVSIREKKGCEIFENLTTQKSKLVLDPTLLLKKDDWNSNLKLEENKKNKYVLIYMLEFSKELIEIGKKFAREHNMKYKIISGTPRACYYHGVQWWMSPQKFAKLFYNSEYVFTNSFHGTVFAMNYNKQFFVKLLVKNNKVNNRLTNVLSNFNLEKRVIKDDILDDENINYNEVNVLLDEKRKESIDFLKKALKENENEK